MLVHFMFPSLILFLYWWCRWWRGSWWDILVGSLFEVAHANRQTVKSERWCGSFCSAKTKILPALCLMFPPVSYTRFYWSYLIEISTNNWSNLPLSWLWVWYIFIFMFLKYYNRKNTLCFLSTWLQHVFLENIQLEKLFSSAEKHEIRWYGT